MIRENNITYRRREEKKNDGKGNMFLLGRGEKKKDEEEYIQAVKYRICRLWFFVFMRSGDHILVYLSYKLCI